MLNAQNKNEVMGCLNFFIISSNMAPVSYR